MRSNLRKIIKMILLVIRTIAPFSQKSADFCEVVILGSGQKNNISHSDLVPIAKTFVFTSKYIYFCRLICFSTNFALHLFINNLFQIYSRHDKKTPMEHFLKYLFYSILYNLAVDD